MKLPQSFTTVTKISKIIALILFIALPFIGFYSGVQYQKGVTPVKISEVKVSTAQLITVTPTNTLPVATATVTQTLVPRVSTSSCTLNASFKQYSDEYFSFCLPSSFTLTRDTLEKDPSDPTNKTMVRTLAAESNELNFIITSNFAGDWGYSSPADPCQGKTEKTIFGAYTADRYTGMKETETKNCKKTEIIYPLRKGVSSSSDYVILIAENLDSEKSNPLNTFDNVTFEKSLVIKKKA